MGQLVRGDWRPCKLQLCCDSHEGSPFPGAFGVRSSNAPEVVSGRSDWIQSAIWIGWGWWTGQGEESRSPSGTPQDWNQWWLVGDVDVTLTMLVTRVAKVDWNT